MKCKYCPYYKGECLKGSNPNECDMDLWRD